MENELARIGDVPHSVAVLLAKQGGVITPRQAVQSGMSTESLRWGMSKGTLVRVRHGVLTTREVWESFHPVMLKTNAAIRMHPKAAASHLTAAKILGLETWVDNKRADAPAESAVWLTRDPAHGAECVSRPDLRLRPASLPPAHVVRRYALPQGPRAVQIEMAVRLTGLPRTVVDLARELPLREALVTADSALAKGVNRRDLDRVIDTAAGWPGVDAARRVVECADSRAESALESISRATLIDGGLPTPLVNVWPGHPGDGLGVRTDLLWSRFWVIGESDGLAKYDDRDPAVRRRRLRSAKEREERLEDYGFQVVRFGWEDAVLRFDELCARFRRAMARGQRTYEQRGPAPYFVSSP